MPRSLDDDAELEVLHVPAEGVAQDHELHEREDHRDDDQRRAAAEAPHLAFDDGECALHEAYLPPRTIDRALGRRLFLERVTKRPARVVHEHIVERRALYRQRLHGDAALRGGFHQRQCGGRAVVRRDADDVVVARGALDGRKRRADARSSPVASTRS